MKRVLPIIAFALLIAAPLKSALAVLVLLNSGERVFGHFIREDDTKITINAVGVDGRTRERTFLKNSDVKKIIHTVERERLAGLSPDSPEAYRDYAEILAGKKSDPEARDTALRLYYLAASLDRENLGFSSVLGMIPLARSPEEEMRFRSMAFLLDPKHDESILVPPKISRSDLPSTEEGVEGLLIAVNHLRSPLVRDIENQGRVARNFLEKPEVQKELNRYADLISLEELMDAARAPRLTDAQLAKVIQLEMAITGARDIPSADEEGSWQSAAAKYGFAPVISVNWPKLTEFDAAKPVFKDGVWVSE